MSGKPTARELASRKQALLDSLTPGAEIRVFGYGSLMWRPGFEFIEAQPALLHGWHRAFCIYSRRYRGTADYPGLVLGLDRGGSCRGVAYRVAGDHARSVMDYLWDREMFAGVYQPRLTIVRLANGPAECHAFVADRRHVQYAGGLPRAEAVRIIRRAAGSTGSNREYLANTVRHLDELGISDGPLHRLLEVILSE